MQSRGVERGAGELPAGTLAGVDHAAGIADACGADEAADDESPLATPIPIRKASREDRPDAAVIAAAWWGGRPATEGRPNVSCLACAMAARPREVNDWPASW